MEGGDMCMCANLEGKYHVIKALFAPVDQLGCSPLMRGR